MKIVECWKIPLRMCDGYTYGKVVYYKGRFWANTIKNVVNVWEPGIYGWAVIV